MNTQKGEDFVVEANGHCFFCLTKVTNSQYPGMKMEHSTLKSHSPSLSINSLQCLSRYLKVDMRKVFNEKDYVPPQLLAMVENARLKVGLCGDCRRLTKSFSKLYRTLEKVEMGMASFANQIQSKLEDADKTGKTKQVLLNVAKTDFNISGGVRLKGKMEIMEALRKEVVQKCADKLVSVQPTVKVQRMTMEQVESKRLKMTSESQKDATRNRWDQVEADASQRLTEPVTGGHPKVEETYPDPYQGDANDFGNDYADDYETPDEIQHNKQSYEDPETTVTPSRSGMTGQGSLNAAQNFQCIFNPDTSKYKCKLCERELGSSVACKRHYNNIHAKIKYKCNLCGKELSQLSAYRRHLRTVHLGVRFQCQGCSKQFTQKCYLTAHLKLSTSCRTGEARDN